MLHCIAFDDMIYTYPICVIESGGYGTGYIYGNNINIPDKPIHLLKSPSIKEMWKNDILKIVITDKNYLIPLDKEHEWELVERWCNQGAHLEFFMRQF